MAHRDLADSLLGGDFRQEAVTFRACPGFEISGAASGTRQVEPREMKAQRQTGSHAANELGVVLALPSADAVIDVGHLQTETERRSGFVQEVQQRHGVRAAGHAHEHRVAGRQHAVPGKGLRQLFIEAHGWRVGAAV